MENKEKKTWHNYMAIQNEANVEIPLTVSTAALYRAQKTNKQSKVPPVRPTASKPQYANFKKKRRKIKHMACSDSCNPFSDSTEHLRIRAGASPDCAIADLEGKATEQKCDFRCSTTRLDV